MPSTVCITGLLIPESVLVVYNDVIGVKMVHCIAVDDMFKYLATKPILI